MGQLDNGKWGIEEPFGYGGSAEGYGENPYNLGGVKWSRYESEVQRLSQVKIRVRILRNKLLQLLEFILVAPAQKQEVLNGNLECVFKKHAMHCIWNKIYTEVFFRIGQKGISFGSVVEI